MNNQDKIIDIKQKIEETMGNRKVKIHDILLFGSRAKGIGSDTSDYDLLIVTTDTLIKSDKMDLAGELRKALASFDTDIDADIIIKSIAEVETSKETIGSVVREALKEGIHI